jgi:hypothetical protein
MAAQRVSRGLNAVGVLSAGFVFAFSVVHSVERGVVAGANFHVALSHQVVQHPDAFGDSLVTPDGRAGALYLGDEETKIFELFPKPSVTQSPALPDCGMQYSVGLLQDTRHPGALNAFARDGKLFEIETVQSRYRTEEGIMSGSSPDDVRLHYKGVDSYLFLRQTPQAFNAGPLVLWVDEKRGIAFSFARGPRTDPTFSVYSIIIFKPGFPVCEEDSVLHDPDSWRKMPRYSLEPPNRSAMAH